ncbi:hypothetical protein [Motiliproteus sp.]|uniref:hypothetical protein n=1 Tax=Motiliproteus sp. TaxID=1898955 RepID=UPI003BACE782
MSGQDMDWRRQQSERIEQALEQKPIDWRFYTPTLDETYAALSDAQLEQFNRLAANLQEEYGEVPAGFNLVGWIWAQLARLQHSGMVDPMMVTHVIDEAYQQLQLHLVEQADQEVTP